MLLSILSCPGGLWKYIKKGTCICSPFFYCTTPYNILILPSLYFKPSFEIDIKSCMPPDPCNCSTSFQSLKFSHIIPLLDSLHLLHVAACTRLKNKQTRLLTESNMDQDQATLKHSAPCSLRAASSAWLDPPSPKMIRLAIAFSVLNTYLFTNLLNEH